MTDQTFHFSEDDGISEKEDAKLLKEKEGKETGGASPYGICGICGTQTKILFSGLGVVTLVAIGILIGATLSGRQHKDFIKTGTDTSQACTNGNIRLPVDIIPLKYRIYEHPNITDGKYGFKGNVRILVEVKAATNVIILHTKSLHIDKTVLRLATTDNLDDSEDFPEVVLKGVEECTRYEQLIITAGKELHVGTKYVIHINFSAKLATILEGFYKSTYTTKGGDKRYLATTHFEATGARSAFPCFDEPAMKATFSIIIKREKIHVAVSNMPLVNTEERPNGLLTDYFQESVRMSTYLVAFVVSDFDSISTVTKKGGVKVSVYAPKEQISRAKFALESASKILDYYDGFFKVKFPLPKLDMIAIPDFGAGAMENWGLVTYRLTSLLYDPKESSSSNKQWVATVVAHEFAHQWFGDLVTMKWWNDLWLNEGFAAFVEYIGGNLVDPSWQMLDQFVLDDVQKSLVLDSHLNSHPISVTVDNPAQINQIFDSISYDKGASIISMMQDFLGKNNFHKGLTDYLNKYKYGNAISDDLWACMTKAQGGTLNVKNIMDTWTLQMGYPVVNVVRHPDNKNEAIVTQKHFITDVRTANDKPPLPSKFNYTWDVPLTYHFEKEKKDGKWFYHTEESVTIPWKKTAKWLKVNVGQIGFYRVNYDEENWNALIQQLNEEHTVLSPADRANLLDDAFELARANQQSTVQALNFTRYLKKEKEYVPFVSGVGSLGYIGGMLIERPGYEVYKEYIMQIMLPHVKALGWNDTGTHLNKYMRAVVLRSAVFHNDTESVAKAKQMFYDMMHHNKSIPANLRSVVYLAVIKYGGRKTWDIMFKKYMNEQVPSEKKKLMYSLTWTSDPKILQHVLNISLNNDIIKSQDSTSVIDSVAGNQAGSDLALKFVKKHWATLYKRYGRGSFDMSRLVKSVFGKAKTQKEYDDTKKFLTTHKLGSGELAATQTLAAIQNHIKWLKKNEASVVRWLKWAVKQ